MTLPNFLIVGAAGSGTTSLYQYLNQHPEIYLADIKEPCYFSDGPPWLVQTDAEYEALFHGQTTEKAIGEASASYLRDPEAPKRIHRLLKDVKVIIILRNPAERAHSCWGKMFLRYGCEKLDFQHALREEKVRINSAEFRENWPMNWRSYHYFHNGLYSEQVKRYFDIIGREKVMVFMFEEFAEGPAEICRQAFSFLGVDPDVRIVFEKHNVAAVARNRTLSSFLAAPPSCMLRMYRFLPVPLKNAIYRIFRLAYQLNLKPEPRPPMTKRLRSDLMEQYRDDVERLEVLLGRSLSDWYG